ncbi:MAG: mercury methylation corrinoid protein HgcA [Desulfuromonadales bacterium]|nr:mercury methylation corrinoid protein HgcA [Desulfuromonadales bacterium]
MTRNCCPPPTGPDEPNRPVAARNPSSACCPPATPTSTGSGCCPEPATATACCPPAPVTDDRPGYKIWPFVTGWLATAVGRVPQVSSRLERRDRLEHWQMRWGLGRMRYSVAAGLYAVGSPDRTSEVLVTANYKMSFDHLRRVLSGRNLWLLVLDTRGINVWCAAGKGTFGTEELVNRLAATGLADLVEHRRLILPQLGAVGVAAHEVKRRSGFQVIYGPVRAADLPTCLDNGLQVAPATRRISFTLRERLVLTPVELVNARKQLYWILPALFVLAGLSPAFFSLAAAWQRGLAASSIYLSGLAGGALLTPLLLPWLPGRAFAVKGALVGLGLAVAGLFVSWHAFSWLNATALLIALPAISSWYAMHFTGSSTFTSPSGVEREMRNAIPAQAAALLVAVGCWLAAAF